MATIDAGHMVPHRGYRITYQVGGRHLTYEGEYLGQEIAYNGHYLLFRHPGFGHPIEIFAPSVRTIETIDEDR